jgi:membrane protein
VDTASKSARLASAVGFVGLVWTGSSFAVAIGHAYDVAWKVPQRVARERIRGLGWLAGAGVLLALGGLATAGIGALPGIFVPLVIVLSLAVDTLVWMWTSWTLPNRTVPWRALVPAAVIGAIGLEILKVIGAYVVPVLVQRSSALYGTLGVVFALLAWLLVLGRLVVFVSVIEVVEWERQHGTDELTVSAPALPEGEER